MINIQMKRIYEPVSSKDGYRVLVDRLWPRGIKKDRAQIDLWAKDMTPTAGLRKDYHKGRIFWTDFYNLYHSELLNNPSLTDFIQTISNQKTVTLLFGGKDTEHTHVKVLADVIMEKTAGSK